MALIGSSWQRTGRLRGGGLVSTVMSNLGLERFLAGRGAEARAAPRSATATCSRRCAPRGYNVGGEQSGHIILSDYATTGDGLVAGLQILAELVATGRPASELLNLFEPLPQLLKNVRFQGGDPGEDEGVKAVIAAGRARLGDKGRLVIRKSGTEPVIRVMAEGEDEALVAEIVDEICAAVQAA